MSSNGRNVLVTADRQALSYLNKRGEEVFMGTIVAEDYQGEVKRLVFQPTKTNPWIVGEKATDGGYKIGVGSSKLAFVNPAAVQRVLLDRGWQIVEQNGTRGGLNIVTTYALPEKAIDDTIMYDRAMWSTIRTADKVWPSIQLWTNVQVGHMAARLMGGWYRLLCTNGLVGKLLGFKTVNFSHTSWNESSMQLKVNEMGIEGAAVMPLGPEISQVRHLRKAIEIIRRFNDERARPEGLSPEMVFLQDHLKSLVGANVKPWQSLGYLTQLELLLDSKQSDRAMIYGLDAVNAYTNNINLRRVAAHGSDRGVWNAMDNTESIISTVKTTANLAALFSSN